MEKVSMFLDNNKRKKLTAKSLWSSLFLAAYKMGKGREMVGKWQLVVNAELATTRKKERWKSRNTYIKNSTGDMFTVGNKVLIGI